jgi:heat-inducible transcriptional repressor
MNERRARILDLVAESYIRSVKPVSSSQVAEKLEVSSATVRNEFGALEHNGYLQQPHTSAGRVPTVQGYSYYAGKFIPPQRLPKQHQVMLQRRLHGVHGDSFWQQVASITAELSGYAVVVSLPADESLQALEIHLSALSTSRLLAVVVLETGLIRQLLVELEPTPSERALASAESSLRQLTVPIGEVPAALADIAKRAEREVARTFEALALAWPHITPPRLFSQGLKNLLAEPESADPTFLRLAVERVEQPQLEAQAEALAIMLEQALALVTARLKLGSSQGELLLLGPLRMRYPEALRVAHGVSEAVSRRFDEDHTEELN